jgi:hypothetical protein
MKMMDDIQCLSLPGVLVFLVLVVEYPWALLYHDVNCNNINSL